MSDFLIRTYPNNITVDIERPSDRRIVGSMSIDLCEGFAFIRLLRSAGSGLLAMLNKALCKKIMDKYNIKEFRFIMEIHLFNIFNERTDLVLEIIEETTVEEKSAYLVRIRNIED